MFCLSVCLSACPRLLEVGVLVYGSCMMLVSVRCPLRPLGLAWSPTPTGWCVGDWLYDLMCCGCMAIWLYIMSILLCVDDASKREVSTQTPWPSMELHAYRMVCL